MKVSEGVMTKTRKKARFAGLLYLLMGISAISIMFVPSRIMVSENATLTAAKLSESMLTFRLSIVGGLISQIIFIFLVIVLYDLFKDVNRNYARLMLALVLVSVPVTFVTLMNQLGALMAIGSVDYLKVFDVGQLNAVMMIFLEMGANGIVIVGVFWGLWLFPFGVLAYRSGFIPKIIGVLLIINCFAYLIDSVSFLIAPSLRASLSNYLILPMCIGELPTIAWLLIKGVRKEST